MKLPGITRQDVIDTALAKGWTWEPMPPGLAPCLTSQPAPPLKERALPRGVIARREVLAVMACEGMSVKEMVYRLGVSASTVYRYLKIHGVELRVRRDVVTRSL